MVTGRPVLTIGFGVFGWVGWKLSACPATSGYKRLVCIVKDDGVRSRLIEL